MGWTYSERWQTKKDLVRHLREEALGPGRVVTSQVVGNVWWAVVKTDLEPGLFIACILLSKDGCWGYKDMEESMGPYEVSCPLSYLDQVPVPQSEHAKGWREKVRAHHAERAAREAAKKSAKLGDVVTLRPSYGSRQFVVERLRKRTLLARAGGRLYRIPTRAIASIAPAAMEG